MSEDRKARLAFIGAGGFATGSLYPNIHKVPQIDLVAVCDLDEARAARAARNFGAREVYTDADEIDAYLVTVAARAGTWRSVSTERVEPEGLGGEE